MNMVTSMIVALMETIRVCVSRQESVIDSSDRNYQRMRNPTMIRNRLKCSRLADCSFEPHHFGLTSS
jgi:hypothetical protein